MTDSMKGQEEGQSTPCRCPRLPPLCMAESTRCDGQGSRGTDRHRVGKGGEHLDQVERKSRVEAAGQLSSKGGVGGSTHNKHSGAGPSADDSDYGLLPRSGVASLLRLRTSRLVGAQGTHYGLVSRGLSRLQPHEPAVALRARSLGWSYRCGRRGEEWRGRERGRRGIG